MHSSFVLLFVRIIRLNKEKMDIWNLNKNQNLKKISSYCNIEYTLTLCNALLSVEINFL